VAYRFVLASLVAFIVCVVSGMPLKIERRHHGFIVLQGILVFGLNYWLIYISEIQLASGLVAVIFSTIVIMNMINSRLFFRSKIRGLAVAGALIGLLGIVLLFWPEISVISLRDQNFSAMLICLMAVFTASLGNMAMARNQIHKLPVLQVNAYGMLYGSLGLIVMVVLRGESFRWEPTLSFNLSLFYLSVFGSVVAFWSYTTLIREIGVEKAGYSALIIPVVALAISTVVEGYQWTVLAVMGLILILLGNYLVMKKPKTIKIE
jgi:drug/metabolite transporter (DMT)-like permease